MFLTDHFTDKELGVEECDSRIIQNAFYICKVLLEPIRDKFGPVSVHDGYRPPAHNKDVGGKPTSYHLFIDSRSAADISIPGHTLQEVFDWIRLESELPFDKVILESNQAGAPACIHLQVDSENQPRRLAYTGHTGDGLSYVNVIVH